MSEEILRACFKACQRAITDGGFFTDTGVYERDISSNYQFWLWGGESRETSITTIRLLA